MEHHHKPQPGHAHHALTIPVLLLSPMIQQWLGVEWRFAGDQYLLLALTSIIYFCGGWPFLDGNGRSAGCDYF